MVQMLLFSNSTGPWPRLQKGRKIPKNLKFFLVFKKGLYFFHRFGQKISGNPLSCGQSKYCLKLYSTGQSYELLVLMSVKVVKVFVSIS